MRHIEGTVDSLLLPAIVSPAPKRADDDRY